VGRGTLKGKKKNGEGPGEKKILRKWGGSMNERGNEEIVGTK